MRLSHYHVINTHFTVDFFSPSSSIFRFFMQIGRNLGLAYNSNLNKLCFFNEQGLHKSLSSCECVSY